MAYTTDYDTSEVTTCDMALVIELGAQIGVIVHLTAPITFTAKTASKMMANGDHGHRSTVASRPLWEASQTEMAATRVASRPGRIGEQGQSLAGSGEQAGRRLGLSITKHEERSLRGAPVLLRRAACCELGTPMGSRYRERDLFGPADRRERFI